MAKLYFRYGAMGSSKTANAIMVKYNYMERGQKALMIKPSLEKRDGERRVTSRSGLSASCVYMEALDEIDLTGYDCLIVDEAQFLTRAQVQKLVHIVDDMNLPVIAYGLRADFRGELFEGSACLMAWADSIEEIKTVCWCGRKATFNTRIHNGRVVREGEQIMLGGNESYVSLCRKHWAAGDLGPGAREAAQAARADGIRAVDGREERRALEKLLLLADPDWKMVEKYLDAGDMYALELDGEAACEAVVAWRADGCLELKNLATRPDCQRRGLAGRMIAYLCARYSGRCPRLYVGTSCFGLYERWGFKYAYTARNFFTDNYPEMVVDDGRQCVDMFYFARPLD